MKKIIEKKRITIISLMFSVILVIFMMQEAASRYVLNKNIDIPIIGSKYYASFEAEYGTFVSESHNTVITVKNNNGTKYMTEDLEFVMRVENSKFNVILSNEGIEQVLAGGDFNSQSFPISITKKPEAILGTNETINITFDITYPFTDTRIVTIEYTDYTSDGLILYYDAINNTGSGHSNSSNVLKDLSKNNNDATLYNAPTIFEKSIRFNGTDQYGRTINTLNLTGYDSVTVEVIVKNSITKGGQIWEHTANWNNIAGGFGLYANTISSGFNPNVYHTNHNKGTVVKNYEYESNADWVAHTNIFSKIASPTGRLVYLNGALYPFSITGAHGTSTTTVASQFTNDYFYFATRGGASSWLEGEISAIRIYNRALTAQEIAKNYVTDQARFNL